MEGGRGGGGGGRGGEERVLVNYVSATHTHSQDARDTFLLE